MHYNCSMSFQSTAASLAAIFISDLKIVSYYFNRQTKFRGHPQAETLFFMPFHPDYTATIAHITDLDLTVGSRDR